MTRAGAIGEPSAWVWWWVVMAACALLLLPLLLVDVPPLHDYPNHLARLFVLAHGGNDPVLARFYEIRWSLIPNLGTDLLGVPLLRWLPVHVGGRVIVGLALVLPFLGAVIYACAAGGRSWWALGSVLVAYNQAFLLGFLNFSMGLGLALMLAAAWLRWREAFPGRVVLLTVLGCVGLFFCHLMAVVFLAVLIGAHEMAWAAHQPARRATAIATRGLVCGGVFLPALVLYFVSRLSGEASAIQYPDPSGKLRGLVTPWVNYIWPVDVAVTVLCVALAIFMAWRGRRAISLRAALTVIAAGFLYLVTPDQIFGLHNVDTRFAILLGFLIFATMAPATVPAWVIRVLVVVFVARMGLILVLWHGHAQALASYRAVIAGIPAGSVVLSVLRPPAALPVPTALRLASGEAMDAHLPALLLVERRAWWPFMFDNAAQQPATARAPYRDLTARIESQRRRARICDLDGIDFILAVGEPLPPAAGLARLAGSEMATLYSRGGEACVVIAEE